MLGRAEPIDCDFGVLRNVLAAKGVYFRRGAETLKLS
jgi:hypothetical protein